MDQFNLGTRGTHVLITAIVRTPMSRFIKTIEPEHVQLINGPKPVRPIRTLHAEIKFNETGRRLHACP